MDTLINNLSPHLFWDVNKDNMYFEKNKKFIIQRVLEYGLLTDWKIIYNYYGINEITQIALNLKDLDEKSMCFISALSKIPKEQFLCYTTKQLTPKHWNF
jgi:hypothetical protein